MKSGANLIRVVSIILFLSVLSSACAINRPVEESTPTPIPTPIIPTKPTYKVAKGEVVRKLEFSGRVPSGGSGGALF